MFESGRGVKLWVVDRGGGDSSVWSGGGGIVEVRV